MYIFGGVVAHVVAHLLRVVAHCATLLQRVVGLFNRSLPLLCWEKTGVSMGARGSRWCLFDTMGRGSRRVHAVMHLAWVRHLRYGRWQVLNHSP